jgi:hypothetical protein
LKFGKLYEITIITPSGKKALNRNLIPRFSVVCKRQERGASNSKFNRSETEKRPEKYVGGPAGWKKAGPLPLLFSTATPSALCGSLFGPLRNGNAGKKKK